MNIDFVELGTYCQTEYRKTLDSTKDKYRRTLFVAIKDDNSISVSSTPHILLNASKCIMIHERLSLAISNWYSWYVVQFINENGEVLVNRIDNDFELRTVSCGGYDNQWLELRADHRTYYSCKSPWNEDDIKSIWDLYVKLKQATTKCERNLIASLFEKYKTILEWEKANQNLEHKTQLLENEKIMYKEILDDIKLFFEAR